jgi:hypothetical protein
VSFTLCDLAVHIVATTGNVNYKIGRKFPNEIMLLDDLKIVCANESNACMSLKNVLRKFVVFPVATTGCISIAL